LEDGIIMPWGQAARGGATAVIVDNLGGG